MGDGGVLRIALIGAGGLLFVAAVVLAIVMFSVRASRARRRRRREEEERARERESLEAFGSTGVLALAATLEGVKLATRVAKVGMEVGRAGLAPTVAGSLRKIADYAESDRPALQRAIAADGTVVLMFSDIEGSTALNQELGDEAWLAVLHEHDAVLRRNVRAERGQVIKTQGDSFMVAFKEVPRALRCATAVLQDLAAIDVSHHPPIRVRIGVHRGEVTRRGRDVFGLNVALAARVAAAARGGEILVSAEARKAVVDAEFDFGKARRVRLKGLAEETTIFPVKA